MKFSTTLRFLHLFVTLAWLGTNRSAGLHKHHVKRLLNQVVASDKGQRSALVVENGVDNLIHGTRREKSSKVDIVKSWKINQNQRHLLTNNAGNKIPCQGQLCLKNIPNVSNAFTIKRNLRKELRRHRRRESAFLTKALDMLDHAKPRESWNFATRATANKPFKPMSSVTDTSKGNFKNVTLVNKPSKTQSGDKRQQSSDTTGDMRPRFFFNSAPAEYVEQKPQSLRRTEHPPIHLGSPQTPRGGPHVTGPFHRMAAFSQGANNRFHLTKHPDHLSPFPVTLVGNPLTHRIASPPHSNHHPHPHHFGPPPYAIHINAPPRLEPPPLPLPDAPTIPPDMFTEPMQSINSPLGMEPRPADVPVMLPPNIPFQTPPPINVPGGAETIPPNVHLMPPEGMPVQPPPTNMEGITPPEELAPFLPPHPPLGIEPSLPPPHIHMMPPHGIPIHPYHPMNTPMGAENDFHMMSPERIPMSPPINLQGMPPPGTFMSPQQVPFPVPVPSPPKVKHVPYPVPVPGPLSIQPVMVPVHSPPKIQQVPVPVESPPKIHDVPVPVPVAVPSPPQVKHIPYPVAYPVKEPGEIQKIFYPIAVPQPSQIHHIPFPVYIRYPPEIRRVPYAVPSPPKPYPVPVPSPPKFVVHRVPYPVMFPQKVPYPIPIVVQHHHIHDEVANARESNSDSFEDNYPTDQYDLREYHPESISNGQCLVNLCLNGGTCSAYLNTYRCHCPSGFQGKHCEEQNMCKPNPCKNFGICSQVEHDYECTCSRGFIGKNCDKPDPCIPSPCQNGATCSSDGSSYSCTCKMGWMGRNCQVESKCLPINPCQNGGTCTEAHGTYQCDCSPGWSGLSCEVSTPETLHQTAFMEDFKRARGDTRFILECYVFSVITAIHRITFWSKEINFVTNCPALKIGELQRDNLKFQNMSRIL